MLPIKELQSDSDDGCDSRQHCTPAGHERLRFVVTLKLPLSLSLRLSLSLSLSLFGSLSLCLCLRLSPHTHTLGKHRGRERRADWTRARALGRSSGDWKMHEKILKKNSWSRLFCSRLRRWSKTWWMFPNWKRQKRKKKEKSHQFGYENLDPRNVRPGETRWDQEPVNSMVRKLLYAIDARFPNLSFF